jgi:hypothetical protein
VDRPWRDRANGPSAADQPWPCSATGRLRHTLALKCDASHCQHAGFDLRELAGAGVLLKVESNYHVARVTVSDDVWVAFRRVAVAQGTPVSRYLGRLVEAELERRKPRPVRRVSGVAGEIQDGLAALREVRLAIDELEAIAGRLARETANRGGRWGDIGPALGLRPDVARSAYQRPSR